MGDEHVARILKMVEDGKISAKEAETLIAALRASAPEEPGPRPEAAKAAQTEARASETGTKSFEFRRGQRRSMPVDLGAIGRQISAAMRQIDPDKILKDATLGGKRLQERLREWTKGLQDDDVRRPVNPLGLPTARKTETLPLDLSADAVLEVSNPGGSITLIGDAESASVEVTREAWAATDVEAELRLGELSFDVAAPQPDDEVASEPDSAHKVTISVTTPPDWRDGVVDLVIRIPRGVEVVAGTTFGDIRVEHMTGRSELTTGSGRISGASLEGASRAETVSGDVHLADVVGPLTALTKSGDVAVERMGGGGEVTTVSGQARVVGVEGGALQVRSVSGEVTVEHAGLQGPVGVSVESVSGDLVVVHAVGTLRLKTVSGDARAERLSVTEVDAQTVSGDLDLAMDSVFSGTLTGNSVSGDIHLCIPDGSNFKFDLATRSGSLSCDHPSPDAERSPHALRGTVGAGTGSVSVQTLSGDVAITRYP